MLLTTVSLPVRSADAWHSFLSGRLGLPATTGPRGEVGVRVGATDLLLREAPGQAGDHHLAFEVPEARFAAAKRWIADRAPLLSLDGADEFECSPSWNAHSVYFDGPDGSVLELIARRDLDPGVAGPFSAHDLRCVSEVGVAVPDVRTAAAELGRAGVAPYGAEPGETFAPVGATDGLLILVAEGRTWFPTADRRSADAAIGIEAVAEGGVAGEYRVGSCALVLTR